jgi:hypothetical protein
MNWKRYGRKWPSLDFEKVFQHLNKLTKGDNEEDGLKAENQTQDL